MDDMHSHNPLTESLPPQRDPSLHEFAKAKLSTVFKARVVICIIMLVFACVGLLLNNFLQNGQWFYWRIMAPVFALASIWLSWYVDRRTGRLTGKMIIIQLAYWIGLMVAILVMTVYVDSGMMGRIEGGYASTILVALSTYSAGLFFDPSLVLIGIVLAVFAAAAGLVQTYLSVLLIPIVIFVAAIIFMVVRRGQHHDI